MAFLSAPYRYVPLSAFVHEPCWAAEVSTDRPFEDGVSGWLDVKITAKTPLLVGGKRVKGTPFTHVHFYETPDGKPAIPGSSWRGMIRGILEIASFGRAAFVDDVREGLRDLSRTTGSEVYRERMRNVEAGWLLPRNAETGDVYIQPCSFARVKLSELPNPEKWNNALPVRDRYAALGGASVNRTLYVDEAAQPVEAFRSARPGLKPHSGALVFTAKTARGRVNEPRKKNREFFFYPTPKTVPPIRLGAAWSEFLRLNTWDVERRNVGGDERRPGWSYWSRKHESGDSIPIFFIRDGNNVDALGTCSMFRVPHKLSKSEMLANTSPRHNDASLRDFPALLFGPAGDEDAASATNGDEEQTSGAKERKPRKGRVSFETAVGIAGLDAPDELGPVVLAAPHGGFYPATVRQPTTVEGRLQGDRYAMFTPSSNVRELLAPELAGRRRAPCGVPLSLPNTGTDDMRLKLHPVRKGAEFKGRVRFHNLKPEELGALVWSIQLWADDWGAKPEQPLRHRLGLGKTIGLGEVALEITDARIELNRLDEAGKRQIATGPEAAGPYTNRFAGHMTAEYDKSKRQGATSTWQTSEQIETLLAFSDPAFARTEFLRNMTLGEYTDAKRQGLVLPPNPRRSASRAGQNPGRESDQDVFPREFSGKVGASSQRGPISASAREGRQPGGRSSGQPANATAGRRYKTPQDEIVVDVGPGNSLNERSVKFEDGEIESWPLNRLTLHP